MKCDQKVFKLSEISEILKQNKKAWHIYNSVGIREFLSLLLSETPLRKVQLDFPNRKETRYLWSNASVFELALSLRKSLYLCHQTAAYIHGLTKQKPKDVYVNYEQPKHSENRDLSQENIDLALAKPVRITRNKAQYRNMTLWILNGMYTGCYGVIEKRGTKKERLRLTNMERTLVDIAVRPVYSGGVSEVLLAYKRAKGKVSIDGIIKTLQEMNYIYPYHQVVGFYLERTGVYDPNLVDRLLDFGTEYNFYLVHGMVEPLYSEKWSLYYPANL
jgi:hypothetical protein